MKSSFAQAASLSILLVCLCGITSAAETACSYPLKATVTVAGTERRAFRAGIADTQEKHQKGLMECPLLEKGRGLLFIFPDTTVRSFWMYRTTLPLAIIFIADDLRVVAVKKGEPNSTLSIPSERPVRYVLEVNWEEGKMFSAGDLVKLSFD